MPVPAKAKALTFHESLQLRLVQLDGCWAEFRAFLADLNVTNPDYADLKQAKDRLKAAQEAVWRLKAAWADEQ